MIQWWLSGRRSRKSWFSHLDLKLNSSFKQAAIDVVKIKIEQKVWAVQNIEMKVKRNEMLCQVMQFAAGMRKFALAPCDNVLACRESFSH